MRLSINWLKDYLEVKLSVEELVERLTMAGLEVEAIEKVGQDTVLEIEITPNRPDCLNMLGLCREVGAITSKSIKVIKPKPLRAGLKKFPVSIADKRDCSRYHATLIEGVKVVDSNQKIIERIASMGTRPISAPVDITNFIMFMTGQPLHVFDYDKIEGGCIVVRRAKQGEVIVTLDGIERKLDPSILVIADKVKPIAIAGIMGGKNTEVSVSTKNILLEAAHFDMGVVRRACRQLGLRSESAYRFERQVDAHQTAEAALRAVDLIVSSCGGRVVARNDVNSAKLSMAKPLKLTDEAIKDNLGTSIPLKRAKDILVRLGFFVRSQGKALLVKAPSFRGDISIVEDLVEEVARIIGFDKLPTSMPVVQATNIRVDQQPRMNKQKMRTALLSSYVDEAITYSMTSRKNVERCALSDSEAIAVTNPLSGEQEILRPALLATLMPSLVLNINRGNRDVRLFEIGNIFTKRGESTQLGVLLTGRRSIDWRMPRKEQVDLTDIKGVVAKVVKSLGLETVFIQANSPGFVPGHCAAIKVGDCVIGHVGQLEKSLLLAWDLKIDGVFYAMIDTTSLMAHKSLVQRFKPLNDFPAITRDVSIAVNQEVEFASIEAIARAHGGELLKEINFIEQYQGDKIPAGQKALVFSLLFQSPTRTLREEEVSAAHSAIIKALGEGVKAALR